MKLHKAGKNNKVNDQEEEMIWLDSINDIDICCGRGKSFNNRKGNLIFQKTIHRNIKRYENATSRKGKSEIVSSIVSELRNEGSRFVKNDQSSRSWYDIGQVQAHEKTGHAIRDCISNRYKKMQSQQPRASIQAIQRHHRRRQQVNNKASRQGGMSDGTSTREEKIADALLLFSQKKNGNAIIDQKDAAAAAAAAVAASTEDSTASTNETTNNFKLSTKCTTTSSGTVHQTTPLTVQPVGIGMDVDFLSAQEYQDRNPGTVLTAQEYQDRNPGTAKKMMMSFVMPPPPAREVSSSSNYTATEDDECILHEPIPLNGELNSDAIYSSLATSMSSAEGGASSMIPDGVLSSSSSFLQDTPKISFFNEGNSSSGWLYEKKMEAETPTAMALLSCVDFIGCRNESRHHHHHQQQQGCRGDLNNDGSTLTHVLNSSLSSFGHHDDAPYDHELFEFWARNVLA